ncbi:MAG TPA: signal peptidase I [Bryobacteraceae bacterium]|jgi:signal peptidase I|nr:signal peptidase I [Bryobacteraceae bacterium]
MQENEILQPPEPDQTSIRPRLRNALSWLRDLAFSVLIAVVLIVFIYQPVKVEGTSMLPTLSDTDRIFINKFTYRFGLGDIERGDTVVFWFPDDTTKSYIKRVIGLPGDLVRIDEGRVYVNDHPLAEGYVEEDFKDQISWPPSHRDRLVPRDRYFVLGDHRNSSSDSRSWGYVPRENIYGKAVFVYWPLNKLGRLR